MSAFTPFDALGNLKHLISLDTLSPKMLKKILAHAETFFDPKSQAIIPSSLLKDQTVVNLFFEPSTRTRSTFEIAAKKLGANVLNFNESVSASSKGESLADTVKNLKAMQCNIFVVRHRAAGAAQFVAQQLGDQATVINAGDGCHAHPTQALLDVFTIQKHRGDISKLNVAIVGDVLHSRVARSQIHALHWMGAQEIRVIAPKTLLPKDTHALGVKPFYNLKAGLEGVDVIMMLRLQLERMKEALLPMGDAFYREFGLTRQALAYAHPNALVVHPGPINRGVEIDPDIADSEQAVILDQVTNGIAIRMAVMALLTDKNNALGRV